MNTFKVRNNKSKKLQKNTDIYLVDSYGESSKFYNLCKKRKNIGGSTSGAFASI